MENNKYKGDNTIMAMMIFNVKGVDEGNKEKNFPPKFKVEKVCNNFGDQLNTYVLPNAESEFTIPLMKELVGKDIVVFVEGISLPYKKKPEAGGGYVNIIQFSGRVKKWDDFKKELAKGVKGGDK